jgi:hypothetical protein
MHVAYEKGGLVVENQPIPWNADAVVVECLARLPATAVRVRDDFQLRIPGRDAIALDSLRRDAGDAHHRLFFRFAPPPATTSAEVLWRRHRLGELTLQVVGEDEFLTRLTLQHPTVAVRLAQQTVACQAFVASQCKSLTAHGLLSSPTALAPLMDLDLRVAFEWDGGKACECARLQLSSSQWRAKQAIVSVTAPPLPRRSGVFVVSWMAGERTLASQRVKSLSKTEFLRSLRISDSRFVVQAADGQLQLARKMPPRGEFAALGPCFLVSSSEAGLAAQCAMTVQLRMAAGLPAPAMPEKEYLITDGPTPLVPGTLPVADLTGALGFELFAAARPLGCLALNAMPTATFDTEGGFRSTGAYLWTAAADDQLRDKLAQLLVPAR